ncbi:transglutaminase-like domain-containing protein [Methanobacterium sp.]|jgi:transglutaminase-like putative cysteine protease|uniref:transglutaminase-like domain-containing protein n=1 Tax=Methanobacterium sp. TaxID=2164 RepID=UPI003158F9EE
MSLIGIAGVSAANIGTATTQTGNHHTVQKDINLHDKYINILKKPIKTQKKVVKKSKTVKKTANTTNNITQFVNKNKTVTSSSKNSVKAKNNTVTKSVPKYAGEKPMYAYGHKKKVRYAHKWYRYHGKWYRYHGKVHKYKRHHTYRHHSKTHRYHRHSSANSASIKSLAHSLSRGTHSQYQKGAKVFNWVRNHLSYKFYYNTRYGANGALKYRTGNCADQAHLVVALARSSGLHARYVAAKAHFRSGHWYGHVWAQIKANGRWYTADPTSNRNSFGVARNWNAAHIKGIYSNLPF